MKKIALIGLVALGLMMGKELWAETYVSGTLSANTTWNMAGSPYIATDTVTVAQGVALTIEPGVTIKFASEISLVCYGTLNAIGTPLGTITFTSTQTTPTASDWNGIKLSGSGANGSKISYCDIGYAEQAIYLENVSQVTITYNYIHDNKGDHGGADEAGGVGCGIYLSGANNNTIGTNTIRTNTGGQGGIGGYCGAGGKGGIGCGIYLSSSTGNTISGNLIYSNTGGQGGTGGDFGSGGSGGVGCGIYLSSSTNNTVSENIFLSNTGGQKGNPGIQSSYGAPGNGYGIYIDIDSYNNIIYSTNIYNSEPIHYYYGMDRVTIENQILTLLGSGSTNLGRIVLINCSNFTIKNNTISGGIGQNGRTSGYVGGIGCGIYLGSSTNIVISRNIVSLNTGGNGGVGCGYAGPGGSGGIGCGIYLHSSTNNTISLNTVSSNTGGEGGKGNYTSAGGVGGVGCGIYLSSSTNNTVLGNIILSSTGGQEGRGSYYGAPGNGYGIYINSNSYNNAIDSSNTYNGEPIHYYYNQLGITIENQNLTIAGSDSTNLGRIVLIYCQNFTIRSNFIAGGIGQNGQTAGGWEGAVGAEGNMGCGIYLGSSTNITISKNIISSNIGGQGGTGGWWGLGGSGGIGCGIYLNSSTNITILENTIFNNKGGQRGNVGHRGSYGDYGQGYGMYSCSSSNPKIHYNNLLGNKKGDETKGYGVWHDGSSGTISATHNWWGHSSGPYHPEINPSGVGDQVSNWILCWPWTYITIFPASGPVGCEVTVEGYGGTNTISIFFGTHLTITTTTSSENGTFSATFITDTQPSGTKVITATDSFGNYATTIFFLKPIPTLSFSPTYQMGRRATVDLTISDIYQFFGAEAYLSFDPAILSVETITKGSFIPGGWLTSAFNNTAGTISVGCGINLGADPVSGSGTLAQIVFNAVGTGTQILEYSLISPRDTVVMDMDGTIGFNRGTATIDVPPVAYIKITPSEATVTVTDFQTFSAQGYTFDGTPISGLAYTWTLYQDIGTISAFTGTQTTFIAGRNVGIGSISVTSQGVGTYADISVIFSTATVKGRVVIDLGTELLGTSGITVALIEEETGMMATTTTGTDSYFSFFNLVPGTYSLFADKTGASPATKTDVIVQTAQETDIGTITLIAGDADNDGRIRIFDFYQLYFALKDGIYNPEVDFDQDGDLDAFDFRVLYNNFFRGRRCLSLARKTDSSIILQAESNKPKVNEEFTITLKIDMVSLVGIEAYLSFDPSILELISVEEKLLDWQAEKRDSGELSIISGVSLDKAPVSPNQIQIRFRPKKEGKTQIFVREAISIDTDGKAGLLSSSPIEIEVTKAKPLSSALGQSFPNPAYNGCYIPFQLSADSGQTTVEIYNIVGQKVSNTLLT